MKQRLIPFSVLNEETNERKVWEYFFVDPKTGMLYYLRKYNSKYIKFSTRYTIDEPSKAKKFANQEFERRIGKKKVFSKTLIGDELEAWLKVKESEGLKYDTMNGVKRAARSLKEYWGDKYPDEINRDEVVDWITWFKANKNIDMENDIKWLRNFCKYLHQKVVSGKSLLPAIPTIKDPDRKKIEARRSRKKERVITPDEFKLIYNSAEDWEHGVVVLFMYTMAARIDETLKLEFGNTIDLENDPPCYRWKVDQNKASLEGMHALHTSLIDPLKALRKLNKAWGTDLLFHQARDVKKAVSSQQIDWEAWRTRSTVTWNWTPHTFRHTCLTNLFNNEANNHLMICKQYRVSLEVAMKTYIKVQLSSILKLQNAIEVKL